MSCEDVTPQVLFTYANGIVGAQSVFLFISFFGGGQQEVSN